MPPQQHNGLARPSWHRSVVARMDRTACWPTAIVTGVGQRQLLAYGTGQKPGQRDRQGENMLSRSRLQRSLQRHEKEWKR